MRITLKPHVLRWARERAGLTAPALARKLHVDPADVSAWEERGQLTFAQAERIAGITNTPVGYLYLPEPPIERLPVTDFRTVGSVQLRRHSSELIDTLHDAQRKQDWFREYLVSLGAEPLAFVGSVALRDDPDQVAAVMREQMGFSTITRAIAGTWEEALQSQIEEAEERGVLVLRNGVVASNTRRKLAVSEFRGFALADRYAPLVFLNNRDSKAAQMFTLAHELAHIWLGVSGVSNLSQTYAENGEVERFCNRVAAELLVPTAELKERLPAAERSDDPIARLGRHFRVSSLVILRRMRDIGALDEEGFRANYEREERRFREIAAARPSGGGNFYSTELVRVSPRFARALVESTLEGRTLYRDALNMLGISKSETLRNLARHFEFVR